MLTMEALKSEDKNQFLNEYSSGIELFMKIVKIRY